MIVNNHEFEIFVSMWNLPAKGAITSSTMFGDQTLVIPSFLAGSVSRKDRIRNFADSELFAQNALSERQSLCNFWRFVLRYSR